MAEGTINIPKFFKDYKGGLEKFKRNLEFLKSIVDDESHPSHDEAVIKYNEINRSMIFINNEEGEGEAIYANGKFYNVGSGGVGELTSDDSSIDINSSEVQGSEGKTSLTTNSGIIHIGEGSEAGPRAFKITNPLGNYENMPKEDQIVLDENSIYEVLYNILNKTEKPTKLDPSMSLSSNLKSVYEVGSNVTGSITATATDGAFYGKMVDGKWNTSVKQNDAGCIFDLPIYKDDGIDPDTGQVNYTFPNNSALTKIFSASIHHSASTNIPVDSVGNNVPGLKISAGDLHKMTSITSKYKMWYGTAPYNQKGFQTQNGTPIEGLDEKLANGSWYNNGLLGSGELATGTDTDRTFVAVIPEGKGIIHSEDKVLHTDNTSTWHKTTQIVHRISGDYCVWCAYFTKKSSSITEYANIQVGDI